MPVKEVRALGQQSVHPESNQALSLTGDVISSSNSLDPE